MIKKLKEFKAQNKVTLCEMARMIDVQISTLERWLKTGRINRVYARMVRERLSI